MVLKFTVCGTQSGSTFHFSTLQLNINFAIAGKMSLGFVTATTASCTCYVGRGLVSITQHQPTLPASWKLIITYNKNIYQKYSNLILSKLFCFIIYNYCYVYASTVTIFIQIQRYQFERLAPLCPFQISMILPKNYFANSGFPE